MKKMQIKKLSIVISAICMATFMGCGKAPTVYYDAAWKYYDNNQPEEAVYNFKLSIAEEAETKEALRGLGIAYIANGQYEEAVDVLIKALNKSNGRIKEIDYDINDYLGYAYAKSGQYQNAVDIYSALLALHPSDTDAYYQRAICYLNMGQMTLADQDFAKVTAKNSENYDLHIQIFFSIKNAGFATEANSYLQAILEDGKRKISDYDRGRMCYYLGNYSDARVYLEKAKDFSNPDTILMLGKTYEAIFDYSYAASLYAQYLDTKGNNAAVYNQLGVCRFNLEDYDGAIAAFSFGLKLNDPEWNKELLYNEAVTYEYKLDYDTALAKFSEYVEMFPKDENAQHEYLFLLTRAKGIEEDKEETTTP